MKHLTEPFDENLYTSALLDFYFKDLRIGVLDIETTGLNPGVNKFILGGLLDCQTGTLHQVFAERRKEEEEALASFAQLLAPLDMVITYNGKHFDMPFIQRRYKTHESSLAAAPLWPYNLDLYLVLNGHSPIKKFVPNLRQKTVESYMGLWETRADEISGKESVDLYDTYEKTGDPVLAEKILLHNSDDVRQLSRLLKVVGKSDFHKAMFHLGFPAGPLTVESIKLRRDHLLVQGHQRCCHLDYMGFGFGDYPVESHFERKKHSFQMKFPVLRDSGLSILDLQAAGLETHGFERYPGYSSGFLVIESPEGIHHMEVNHFIQAFMELFIKSV